MHNTPPTTEQRHLDETRRLAYYLWEEAGCPSDQDFHFWLEAERQLFGPPPNPKRRVTGPNGASKTKGTVRSSSKAVGNGSAKSRPRASNRPAKVR